LLFHLYDGCVGGASTVRSRHVLERAYSVEIGREGTVDYDGKSFVAVAGRASSRIDRASVSALVERLERAGFFRLEWRRR
jgi:hypothetical protein